MKYYDLSDFSITPFGRYLDDGKFNGTTFREVLAAELYQAKNKQESLTVDFDNVELGIGSSFLEESFGGLVRKGLFTKDELINGINGEARLLVIKSQQDFYNEEVEQYISEAKLEK